MLRPLIVFVCLAVLPLSPVPFAEADVRPGGPRVRAQDSRAARFIKGGLERSATMRALIERIEASDVIVYVSTSPLMPSRLSGALSFVTASGGFRYLRATINAAQLPDLIIATLAHEFQHVIEVIDHPSVIDEGTMGSLYRSIGIETYERPSNGFETRAAQLTGARVRRELTSTRTIATGDLEASKSNVEPMYSRYSRDL